MTQKRALEVLIETWGQPTIVLTSHHRAEIRAVSLKGETEYATVVRCAGLTEPLSTFEAYDYGHIRAFAELALKKLELAHEGT